MSNDNKEQPKVTAGLDLGDKYSHLCLLDTVSGEVIEEGRLRTTAETLEPRFAACEPMRIAIEVGTHIRPGSADCWSAAVTRSWLPMPGS